MVVFDILRAGAPLPRLRAPGCATPGAFLFVAHVDRAKKKVQSAKMLKVFCGYDPRQSLGWHVFCQSLIEQSSIDLQIIPLSGDRRDGTQAFTYARFLVPEMCRFKGHAIYLDASDMLMLSDIAELEQLFDPSLSVQVVKHQYTTKHKRKFVGTEYESKNEDYPRKNWSSVMLWNCEHFPNRILTAEYVSKQPGAHLHRFGWLRDEMIGELSSSWNVLVGEMDNSDTKIAHFTLGLPDLSHYTLVEYSNEWYDTKNRMLHGPMRAKEKRYAAQ
jgi:lipopolysaccharide biosynthesis glycosyltransferase